jgi:hypothetical protein
MDQRTHEKIAPHLCGRPVELEPGRARVVLEVAGLALAPAAVKIA